MDFNIGYQWECLCPENSDKNAERSNSGSANYPGLTSCR